MIHRYRITIDAGGYDTEEVLDVPQPHRWAFLFRSTESRMRCAVLAVPISKLTTMPNIMLTKCVYRSPHG